MLSLPDFKEKNVIICFSSEGQKISFKNDNIIIKGKEDEIILQLSCYKIFSLWIIGPTLITSGLLEKSKKFAFSIYLLSYSYRLYGIWCSATEGNFILRQKQYNYASLDIAKRIVSNKIHNQLSLIKSIRKKHEEIKQTIDNLSNYEEQALKSENIQTLLGTEGIASRIYFQQWFSEMDWNGRKPRTKSDFINTTLDIGYTYLFNFMECMLNLYGFDIYQGVYHRCFYQRKSLVCDLVEPFRPIIDHQIKKSYGLKQLKKEDFDERKNQFYLKPDKNKEYTRWMIESILNHKESMFNYVQEYYRCFMRNKPIDSYPFFKL